MTDERGWQARSVSGSVSESVSRGLVFSEGWVEDTINAGLFQNLGLVNGAVFTDLNADRWPDLVVACDWGPLRLFKNNGADRWTEVTRGLGLEGLRGWW
ncbi:MAG: hypothetical protein IT581_15825 [Verrucomicrobiales bacterium]|nr:hypothetical protein [Verrucomicrobiales bacterium]